MTSTPANPLEPARPRRQVERVRHELKRRALQVVRTEAVGSHLRRVVLAGDDLADFNSPSFEDHVKLIFGAGPDGAPVMRDYTPRRHDRAAGELAIDFVMHGDGPAAAWARQAAPGAALTVGGPRGSFLIPADYDWHLLAGDLTALPAIARRLEELPGGANVTAWIVAPDAGDRIALPSAANVTLRWLDDSAALLDAAREWTLPAGEGYAWCAGEAAATAALRRVLVEEKGHDSKATRAVAYWKQGAVAHHEHLEA